MSRNPTEHTRRQMTRNPAPHTKRIWTAIFFLSCLIVGALLWFRTLPEYTAEEVAHARQVLNDLELELTRVECHRPAITGLSGEATTDDLAAELLGLLQDPELQGCRDFLGTLAHRNQLFDAELANDAEMPGDDPADDSRTHDETPGARYIELHTPPAAVLRADLAPLNDLCASLPGRIERLAAASQTCCPFDHRFGPSPSLVPYAHLADVAMLFARRQAGRGDTEGALLFLAQTYAAYSDLSRGPTSLLVAGVGAIIRERLVSHMASLIASATLSPEVYRRIADRLALLAQIEETPAQIFQGERATMARTLGVTDADLVMLANNRVEEWCDWGASAFQCLRGSHAIPHAPAPTDFDSAMTTLLGRRVGRTARNAFYLGRIQEMGRPQIGRWIRPSLMMQAVRVLLWAIQERAHGGRCPTSVATSLTHVSFSPNPMILEAVEPGVFEIRTPALPVEHIRSYALRFDCTDLEDMPAEEDVADDAVAP